jgi:photosystem II stability/assembly factor-like uncharacterized protein
MQVRKHIKARTLILMVMALLVCFPVLIIGSWALSCSDRSPNVRVQFVNSQVGWIVGPRLLQTKDGGRTWQAIRSDGYGTFKAESIGFGHRLIQFIDPNFGVQLDLHAIAKTQDGGGTWSEEVSIPKKGEIPSGSLFFLSRDVGWLVTEAVYQTRDGGRTWKRLAQTPLGLDHRQRQMRIAPTMANFIPALWFTDSEHGIMARLDGEIYHTRDGGQTWTKTWSQERKFTDIFFVDNQNGWITGNQGFIAGTKDGGVTWSPVVTSTQMDLNSIFFISDKLGWAVGSRSTILYTKDGGATWAKARVSGLTPAPLASVSFADPLHGWAVGGNSDPMYPSLLAPSNVVLSSEDGGQIWRSIQH